MREICWEFIFQQKTQNREVIVDVHMRRLIGSRSKAFVATQFCSRGNFFVRERLAVFPIRFWAETLVVIHARYLIHSFDTVGTFCVSQYDSPYKLHLFPGKCVVPALKTKGGSKTKGGVAQ